MNHPKGLTVDDGGNIYIADTMNMAIRKISDEGVTTIAGGKRGQLGGHIDGPGEDAKFSNDFDLVYVGSSCSLLVVDRGNLAIREIQLHHDDCTSHHHHHHQDDDISFHLGIAVLVAATFFGYMLALLQWRIRAMFSSHDDPRAYNTRKGTAQQRPPIPKSVRPPLIPNEEEYETTEEGFFGSIGRLLVYSGSAFADIFGSLFSGGSRSSKRKALHYQFHQQQVNRHPHPHPNSNNVWPVQDSFVIPDEDEPPPPCLETRTPTAGKTYPFMSHQDLDKPPQQHLKQTRAYLSSNRWDGDYDQQQQQHHHQRKQLQHHQHQHQNQYQQQLHTHYSSSTPKTYYDHQNCETNEIVFGAVQEQDGRREAMVIKAVDYGDSKYSHHNLRPRLNYVGYNSHGY
ncbi:NHL repeat [Senna tora]|uniref:NHL repeat n=1 Tax=Senna tora TaxID=362788 RepID=A0A834TD59_9FABA|nr:NHL repeat [Senna tora]